MAQKRVSVAATFATLMDNYVWRVLADDDPDANKWRGVFLRFESDPPYDIAGLADQVTFDISELVDAPSGPRSMELCLSTLIEFVREWAALEHRETEEVQRAFFVRWVEKVDNLFTNNGQGWR